MVEYRQVRLADNQTVIESFLREQWAETGDKGLSCKPHWAMYLDTEKAGRAFLLVAYSSAEGGRPIGYAAAFIHPHVNSIDNLVGSIPTYYVEVRPGRAAILRSLLSATLDELRKRGAMQANIKTEYAHSADRLLRKMGFCPVEIGYKLPLTRE